MTRCYPLGIAMASRSCWIRRWIALPLLLGLLVLLLLAWQGSQAPETAGDASVTSKPLRLRELPASQLAPIGKSADVPSFPADAPQLTVGLLLKNIYNLRLDSQTFR